MPVGNFRHAVIVDEEGRLFCCGRSGYESGKLETSDNLDRTRVVGILE